MPSSPAQALRLLVCVLSLSLATGCGNACLSLASQVCQCQPDDGNRAACNRRAKEQQVNFPITKQDENFCEKQIDSHACDCKVLDTAEGRVGCGIAFGN